MQKKILKGGGYCCDGCQWNFCDFYDCRPIMIEAFDGESIPSTRYKSTCTLFNVELTHGSLKICNVVYGFNYEGRV